MRKHQNAPALDQRMYYARLKTLWRKSKGRHGGQNLTAEVDNTVVYKTGFFSAVR
jgi:hypothetical protein